MQNSQPTDPTVIVAIVSTIGILISSIIAAGVAVLTNRRETKGSAEDASDKTADKINAEKEAVLRERIAFRDEQLTDLRNDLSEAQSEIAALKLLIVDLTAQVERQRKP